MAILIRSAPSKMSGRSLKSEDVNGVAADAETAVQFLPDGSYLVDYGPVTLVVKAVRGGRPIGGLNRMLLEAVRERLAETTAYLPLLRGTGCHRADWRPGGSGAPPAGSLPAVMIDAVRASGDTDLTPMAAVAGAMSDRLADQLAEMGADKAFVNNGGDIALRLKSGQTLTMAVMHDMRPGGRQTVITLSGADGIGGVATSGLGGRSLTKGIANGVTVFAARCALADALATSLANQSYVPDPAVRRCPAGALDPSSDIADRMVVTQVGALPEAVADQAVEQVLRAAAAHCRERRIQGISVAVQRRIAWYPDTFFEHRKQARGQ